MKTEIEQMPAYLKRIQEGLRAGIAQAERHQKELNVLQYQIEKLQAKRAAESKTSI